MASKVLFNATEDELLVEMVAKYPSLYDLESELYKDQIVKDNAWKEIAEVMARTGKKPKICGHKVSLPFSNSFSNSPTPTESNKEETVEEISDLKNKASLTVIQEDIDKKLEEVSERLATIETINKQIDNAGHKSQEELVQETVNFVNELVDNAVTNIETKPITPTKKKLRKSEISKAKIENKITTKEKDNIPKINDAESNNLPEPQSNLEGILNNLKYCRSIISSNFENVGSYRTVLDPKEHRLIKEKNDYSQLGTASPHLSRTRTTNRYLSPSNENPLDIQEHFLARNILDKTCMQKNVNQKDHLFPEILPKSSKESIPPKEPPSINLQNKEDITEYVQHPKSTKSTKSIKSNKSLKSRKSSSSSLPKIVLDNTTYKKICTAIQSSLAKEEFSQLGDVKRSFKSSSNYGLLTTGKKSIPMRSTDLDLNKFSLNMTRVKKPRNKRF